MSPINVQALFEQIRAFHGLNAIISYITDREPGEGIILTSTSNIAFTDRLGDEEHLFYKLFY